MICNFVLDSKIARHVQNRVYDEICSAITSQHLEPWPHVFGAEFFGPWIASSLSHRVAKVVSKSRLRITLTQLISVDLANMQCLGLPVYAFIKDVDLQVSFFQIRGACFQICKHDHPESLWDYNWLDLLISECIQQTSWPALQDPLVEKLKPLSERGGSICIVVGWFTNHFAMMFSNQKHVYELFVDDLAKELGGAGFAEVRCTWP
jgi:hypothetical protein